MGSRRIKDPTIHHIDVDAPRQIRPTVPTRASRPVASRARHAIDVDSLNDISIVPFLPTHDRVIDDVESYDSSFCCIVCQESCPSSDAIAPPCGHVCCWECWKLWGEVVAVKEQLGSGRTSCPSCRQECRFSDATGVEFEAAVIMNPDEISQRLNDKYKDLKKRNSALEAAILDFRQSVEMRRQDIASLRTEIDEIYMVLRSQNLELDS